MKQGTEELSHRVEFPGDEWALLLRFARFAEEFVEHCLPHQHTPSNIRYDAGVGYSSNQPEKYDVGGFLHWMRPFLVDSEETNFHAVYRILSERMDHPLLRRVLKREKERFSGKVLQGMMTIKVDSVLVNSEEVFKMWVNSVTPGYHRRPDNAQKLADLLPPDGLPLEHAQVFFLQMLWHKTEAVVRLAQLVRAMEHRKGSSVSMRLPGAAKNEEPSSATSPSE